MWCNTNEMLHYTYFILQCGGTVDGIHCDRDTVIANNVWLGRQNGDAHS